MLEDWRQACGSPASGFILRPVRKGGHVADVGQPPESPISAQALAARVKRLSGKVGLDLGGLHNLRRWSATSAVEGGVPLPVVQRQLGHADPRTTSSHLRADEATDSREVRDKFPAVFRGAAGAA